MSEMSFALTMLGSKDIERAVTFYTDVLGLRIAQRQGDFVLFETGATTLAITGELASAQTGDTTHEIVFGVPSVTKTYALLKDRIAFLNEPRVVNAANWAVNFRDPDGHLCSFFGLE